MFLINIFIHLLYIAQGWEEIVVKQEQSDEGSSEMKISLPSMPSLYVISFLCQACEEIHSIGGHVLNKSIVQRFALSLIEKVQTFSCIMFFDYSRNSTIILLINSYQNNAVYTVYFNYFLDGVISEVPFLVNVYIKALIDSLFVLIVFVKLHMVRSLLLNLQFYPLRILFYTSP